MTRDLRRVRRLQVWLLCALARHLSRGATEQAASLEETSASMEELSSITRRNAKNPLQAATSRDLVAQLRVLAGARTTSAAFTDLDADLAATSRVWPVLNHAQR